MQLIEGVSLREVLGAMQAMKLGGGHVGRPSAERAAALLLKRSTPERPDGAPNGDLPANRPEYFRRVAKLGLSVARALSHSHQRGILHRDIKPSNIMLDRAGAVWVTDFGLAKHLDREDLTASGDAVGTVRYMAPEQFRGRVDARSDVHSLGLLLLGLWNGPVKTAVLQAAARLKEQGKVRLVAVSVHQREAAARHLKGEYEGADILHVRYNAAHRGAETDIFPHVAAEPAGRPGIVNFTATRWGTLLRPSPDGEPTPTAGDCYRFALTRPEVDLCLTGPRNRADVQSALEAIAKGPMDEEELAWMRRVGDRIYAERKGKGETSFLNR